MAPAQGVETTRPARRRCAWNVHRAGCSLSSLIVTLVRPDADPCWRRSDFGTAPHHPVHPFPCTALSARAPLNVSRIFFRRCCANHPKQSWDGPQASRFFDEGVYRAESPGDK